MLNISFFPTHIKAKLEEQLKAVIASEKQKYDTEIKGLRGRKNELEHKRAKLMEAHYMDAIPLDFMKSEQQKITKELAAVEHESKQHEVTFDEISKNLSYALEMLNDCGAAYRQASDKIKRLMNQALFEKIYVTYNEDNPLAIEHEYMPPFDMILAPAECKDSENNSIAKSRIPDKPGCGIFANNSTFMRSYSNFFRDKSSSNKLLVEIRRFEPLASYMRSKRSTS